MRAAIASDNRTSCCFDRAVPVRSEMYAHTALFGAFGLYKAITTQISIPIGPHKQGIMAVDPVVSLDREGVGELLRIATQRGRKVRKNPDAFQ